MRCHLHQLQLEVQAMRWSKRVYLQATPERSVDSNNPHPPPPPKKKMLSSVSVQVHKHIARIIGGSSCISELSKTDKSWGVLPHLRYIGLCHCEGYRVLSGLVQNRV